MTKILIISNKSDLTSDFIVKRLKEKKISFYRFNTEELTKSVSITLDFSNDIFCIYDLILKQNINLKDFTSVYFRRPELPSLWNYDLDENEKAFLKNEIAYTLEGIYSILKNLYWVSPIYAIRQAENKILQLQIAKKIGFKIPDSLITNSFDNSINFFNRNAKNCIIKPIKSGLIGDGNNSKVVFTSFLDKIPHSKEQIKISPNFFQSHIEKKGDVRVTMVGKKAFATLIHSQENNQTKVDWRKDENILKHSKIKLPESILYKCIKLLSKFSLKFGAIDFILDKNDNFIFLEINPNGQWAWIEKQTEFNISNEIVNLLSHENF
ncbi:MAG: MvdC/MvdD family ATP grasp protein [Nanoarchaeota archaeon]